MYNFYALNERNYMRTPGNNETILKHEKNMHFFSLIFVH